MASFNRVILAGNLTRDPQLRHLQSGTSLCEFGLAVNRKYTVNNDKREDVTFVDCTAFGKPAEIITQYCNKGKGILVEGRLKYDQWEDKNGGGKRTRLSVVVENFQFLGGPGDGQGATQSQRQATDDPHELPEDDIPF